MRKEGLVHHGVEIRCDNASHRIPLSELADGRSITVYGQQEVVKDWSHYASRPRRRCTLTPRSKLSKISTLTLRTSGERRRRAF